MKQKVLIFIDWFSPGFKAGGPTASNVNIVDHLAEFFDFYVITSDTDYHAEKPYPEIESDKWIDRGNYHVFYFSKEKLNFKNLLSIVNKIEIPVWYINGVYSRFFSIYPLIIAKKLNPKKVIVSARGMLSPHAFANKGIFKNLFINSMKLAGFYKGVHFHGTNANECEDIKNKISKNTLCNPIENLPRKSKFQFSPTSKQNDLIRLVSFARISPEKNTLYAIQALKHCTSNVTYDIFGQINSEVYWNECKGAIKNLPPNVLVSYKGSVNPSEMSNLYKNYDVMYLPTTGENFGHAILESFMNSRPVIISDTTPWKDLESQNIGFDISLDDPKEFAKVIDKMAKLPRNKFELLNNTAYRFAKEYLNSHFTVNKYIELLSSNK